jgi:predicted metal-binding membrane protein
MDAGPGVALGGFGWFTATWLVMMAAMMVPATLPAFALGRISQRRQVRFWRPVLLPAVTIVAFLAVWTVAGALVYLGLRASRSVFGGALTWREGGQWLCVAVVAVAAGYQLTSVKARWLARCRTPLSGGTAGSVHAAVRSGLGAGLRCLASSWALMAVLFALGAMSLVWMVLVAVLIGIERLSPPGWWSTRVSPLRAASAGVLLGLAVALATAPASLPGFTLPGSPAAQRAMTRMDGMRMSRGAMGMPAPTIRP